MKIIFSNRQIDRSGRPFNQRTSWQAVIWCGLFFCYALAACTSSDTAEKPSTKLDKAVSKVAVVSTVQDQKPLEDSTTSARYSWLSDYEIETALINQVPAPAGASRPPLPEGSFGDWLRHLPLKPANAKLHLYNGELKSYQDYFHRIINIDVGERDLQQCADAVMRLKAEYHYSLSDYERIHFNYTSGDRVSFDDWRRGKKPIVLGNLVRFSPLSGEANNSYANFKKYLNAIFNYAGTASLSKELKRRAVEDLSAGDVFIQGGFPGHAVLVMDVAKSADQTYFLLAQSYMPAQDIHVLVNVDQPQLSPWYTLEQIGTKLVTPEWDFKPTDLKRFE